MSVMVLAVYFSIAFRNFSSLPRPNRRTLLVVSSLVVVSLIQLTAFVVASYNQLSKFQQERLDQILGILNGQVNSQTTTNRSDLAQVGIDFIADSPLWGWGFGAFHYIRSGNDAGIHNMFLLLMGESGIVPTLLFGLFFMVAGVRSWQLRKVEYRFFCLAFLFVALFFANGNHNLFDTYEVSFMFGLVCALIKIDAIERTQTIENQFFTPNTEGATTT